MQVWAFKSCTAASQPVSHQYLSVVISGLLGWECGVCGREEGTEEGVGEITAEVRRERTNLQAAHQRDVG